jgi:DNA-binding winged helix-turn-helix (wHTH) protein
MPERPRKTSISFGEFRLEILSRSIGTRRDLYRGDGTNPEKDIQPRSLEVLECLLRRASDVIEREDVVQELWGDKLDESGNLDHHINAIRKALRDDSHNPRILRTVRGHGLEIMVPVRIHSDDGQGANRGGAFSEEDAQAFEEFFGPGTADTAAKFSHGAVVVQADHLDRLAVAPEINVNDSIRKTPGNRSYKARTWVNYNDLLCTQALVKLFESHSLKPPQTVLSVRNSREDLNLPAETAFIAAVGLGFTDRSTRALKICHPWMRVSRTSPAGDAIAIHPKLVLRYHTLETAEKNGYLKAPDEPDFWIRLPHGWSDTYLDTWLEWLDIDNTVETAQDYAIILRHTQLIGGQKQILFVLAGFTERGSAIAGRYLALHWRQLWKNYVEDQPDDGDFLALIEGPSDPGLTRSWQEDKSFTITPQIIHDLGITGCNWFDRVEKRLAQEKGSNPKP